MITVSKGVVDAVLAAADEQILSQEARKRLPTMWRDMAMFKFHDSSLETMMHLLMVAIRNSHGGEMDLTKDGDQYTLVFSHKLGRKFSLLMLSGIDELLRSAYRILPTIEYDDSLVTFKFSER